MALLAALVLLALSAALATATFSASRAVRRAALTTQARARVDVGVRRAFGEVLVGWSVALDTMPIGSTVALTLEPEPVDAGPPLIRRASVARVTADRFAVTVDLLAYALERPVARRRARLWLERPTVATPAPGDPPAALPAPVVVTSWAFADLY